MFFSKALLFSAVLASVARAAPISDDDDSCWDGDESVPDVPSPLSSTISHVSSSSNFSTASVASGVTTLAGFSSAAPTGSVSVASASPKASAVSKGTTSANAAGSLSGQATFYDGNTQGGTCSFSTYTLPSGMFGTALSDSDWDNSANCGACVAVTGPDGNSITAMITDQCPGCGENHLDLYPDAFAKLADPSTGVIDVTWDYVDCGISSPLQLHQKEGVSENWFSMQVVNANGAVSKLEVSTDGGITWKSTERQTYNFFELSSGTGSATADIKVTSSSGSVVTVPGVTIQAGALTTAGSNF